MSDFAAYTGQTWSDYLASSPKYAVMYIVTKRLIGHELFPISVLIILVAQKSYSRGEKWSWFALLIAGAVTWGSLIGYRIVIGYFVFDTLARAASTMTPVVGLVLLVVGLTVPAKEILGS